MFKVRNNPILTDVQKKEQLDKIALQKEEAGKRVLNTVFAYNAVLLSISNTLLEAKWILGTDKSVHRSLKK